MCIYFFLPYYPFVVIVNNHDLFQFETFEYAFTKWSSPCLLCTLFRFNKIFVDIFIWLFFVHTKHVAILDSSRSWVKIWSMLRGKTTRDQKKNLGFQIIFMVLIYFKCITNVCCTHIGCKSAYLLKICRKIYSVLFFFVENKAAFVANTLLFYNVWTEDNGI